MNKRNDIDPPTITESRLYIIVRSDIADLTPGKLGAQTAHAASMLANQVTNSGDLDLQLHYANWEGDRHFGTTVVLTATKADICSLVDTMCNNLHCLYADVVVDPSYPFRNYFGEMFTAEELTCGYVFVTPNTLPYSMAILRKYPLHP